MTASDSFGCGHPRSEENTKNESEGPRCRHCCRQRQRRWKRMKYRNNFEYWVKDQVRLARGRRESA